MTNPALENIRYQVGHDPRWISRAILAIYKFQTENEKAESKTIEHNSVGFSGPDCGILTSFAKQLLADRTLSEKQLAIAKRVMPRYAGQLCDIAGIPRTIKKPKNKKDEGVTNAD